MHPLKLERNFPKPKWAKRREDFKSRGRRNRSEEIKKKKIARRRKNVEMKRSVKRAMRGGEGKSYEVRTLKKEAGPKDGEKNKIG